MHSLGTVWDAKFVFDGEPRMAVVLLPGQFVGANVEPAPALRIGDEAGDGHRSLDHGG